MELKEFVSSTLLSIVEGVADAQSKSKASGARINPTGLMRNKTNVSSNAIWDNSTNNYAQSVSFNVVLTVEDSAKAGGKIKVLSGIFGGEGGGEKSNKNINTNSIQFSVPVLLNGQDVANPDASKSDYNKGLENI